MASQAIIYGVPSLLGLLMWALITTNTIPLLEYGRYCPCFRTAVTYAPIWIVAALGVYAVFSVLYGVTTFNDCEDARNELVSEIKEAREDLKKKKII